MIGYKASIKSCDLWFLYRCPLGVDISREVAEAAIKVPRLKMALWFVTLKVSTGNILNNKVKF